MRSTLVVTVTPNPSLDLTYQLPAEVGPQDDVHRAVATTLEPSGKGVNVALSLHAAGRDAVAVLPSAGATGRHLTELIADAGLPHRTIAQPGQTRVNTTVLRAGAPTTKYNAPGPALDAQSLRALVGELLGCAAEVLAAAPALERWLVVCGSLPPQGRGGAAPVAAGLARQAVAVAGAVGARCALDVSGATLSGALGSGADLLAPNVAELAAVDPDVRAAVDSGDPDALAVAVRALSAHVGSQLLVSAGARGALWTDGADLLHATGAPLRPVNTAGAGDALLAGWLADAESPERRLERAVRWGRSACLAATTVDDVPGGRDAGEVTVRRR